MRMRFWKPDHHVNTDRRIAGGLIVIGVAVGFMVAAVEVIGIGL